MLYATGPSLNQVSSLCISLIRSIRELQSAANRVGEIEARQAVAAGTRYAAYVLNNYAIDGVVPDTGISPDPAADYHSVALPVGDDPGDPQFWFIGRDVNRLPTTTPVFCLMDEASKINLNSATPSMLLALPMTGMTSDFAAAIVNWRTRQSQTSGSALNSAYSTLNPPRLNKGAPFESVDELRLVYGATLDLLFGEDTNLNGTLDPNEDDGDQSPPHDNQDGQLQPGMFEYVTAFSSQPNSTRSGSPRLNISNIRANSQSIEPLRSLLAGKGISTDRTEAIVRNLSTGTAAFNSVASFFLASGMTETNSPSSTPPSWPPRVPRRGWSMSTPPVETVLACIPGIGLSNAPSLVPIAWPIPPPSHRSLAHPRAQSRCHPSRRALHHGPVLSILRGYRRGRAVLAAAITARQVGF